MKGNSFFKERLNVSIKELLSEYLLRRVKDPRIGFVTITDVEVSGDLSYAKVYYSVMGDEQQREESLQGLQSAKNFLRKAISKELKMRVTPDFRFIYDDTLDRSLRLEETLQEIKKDDEEKSG